MQLCDQIIQPNGDSLGKVLKDYIRSEIKLVMKWGPWFPPGQRIFTISPGDCRQAPCCPFHVIIALRIVGKLDLLNRP